MTSLADLKSMVQAEVGRLLAPRGYKLVKSDSALRRSTPLGWWELHLAFIYHKPVDVDVFPSVGARFDAVQDVLFEGDVASKGGRGTMTIGATFGNIAGGGVIDWTVASAADVPRVAKEVVGAFDRIGQPYLLKYAEPAAVLEKLLGTDPDAWHLWPDAIGMRCRALALAYVLEKHELIEPIIARAEAERAKDPNLPRFRALAERIRAKRSGLR